MHQQQRRVAGLPPFRAYSNFLLSEQGKCAVGRRERGTVRAAFMRSKRDQEEVDQEAMSNESVRK